MLGLSIVSACNNNCEYCFQQNDYHKRNLILDYNDIIEIFNWAKGIDSIGILGGEPTLHPQFIDVCKEALKRFEVILFTNLLCEPEIIENISQYARLSILINTTTRIDMKDLFEENLKLLSQKTKNNEVNLGITITGDVEYDSKHIDNIAKLVYDYPIFNKAIRVALATPNHDKVFDLIKHDKSLELLYDTLKKASPKTNIYFDCSVNMCQMSREVFSKILNDSRTSRFFYNCDNARIDIMADKTFNYCGSVPSDFFGYKTYDIFSNWEECIEFVSSTREAFMAQFRYFCKDGRVCTNKNCAGACFALIANLVKQKYYSNTF